MPRNKNKTLSIRTTAEIKDLLRQAAERERSSVTAMVEALVVNYVQQHGLKQTAAATIGKPKKK
jgi:uncharacterized protein (DUF1778 family)